MLVWGGGGRDPFPGFRDTGGRYDPATDTWVATSTVRAPSPRWFHESVWTRTEMIVWGGKADLYEVTGGRYCASPR